MVQKFVCSGSPPSGPPSDCWWLCSSEFWPSAIAKLGIWSLSQQDPAALDDAHLPRTACISARQGGHAMQQQREAMEAYPRCAYWTQRTSSSMSLIFCMIDMAAPAARGLAATRSPRYTLQAGSCPARWNRECYLRGLPLLCLGPRAGMAVCSSRGCGLCRCWCRSCGKPFAAAPARLLPATVYTSCRWRFCARRKQQAGADGVSKLSRS